VSDFALLPPVPLVDPDSAGYWQALEQGTFAICRCLECRLWMHPPLERCRRCGGKTGFEAVSGRGNVFSFIVVRHPTIPGFVPPYVVALVELDEQAGLRLSAIVHADPADVAIGAPVQVVIREIGSSGFQAPSFELVR
jgi:uncharacterized OB-fold protein